MSSLRVAPDPVERLKEVSGYWMRQYERFERVSSNLSLDCDFSLDLSFVHDENSTFWQADSLLNNVFDASDTLAVLWHQEVHHVPSDYVLMRTMVDSALRVIWLLDPDDTQERVGRAWRLARDAPARSKLASETMLKGAHNRPSADSARTAAQNASCALTSIDAKFRDAGIATPPLQLVKPEETIPVAEAKPFHVGRDGDVQRLWSQLSELVHGSAVPVRFRQNVEDGKARPNVDHIAKAASLVTRLVEAALDQFHERAGGSQTGTGAI